MIISKPIPTDLVPPAEFASKAEVDGDCLVWRGSVNAQGYGRITRGGITYQAHRVALALAGVPLPQGKVVDHRCRNRKCVNVDHLEVVEPRQNTARGTGLTALATTARESGYCINGHEIRVVGLHKAGNRMTCAECGRARASAYRARHRA